MNELNRRLRTVFFSLGSLAILVFGLVVSNQTATAAPVPTCVTERSTDGVDTVLLFKNVGQCNWLVPTHVTRVTYLVVAGGGGGGGDAAGGGGAGGLLTNFGDSTLTVTPTENVVVEVGAGGVAGHNGPSNDPNGHVLATSGGNSRFGAVVALGGGFGGVYNSGNGGSGGSGGGGAFAVGLGGSASAGQGFSGGDGANGGSGPAGAGGGGAGGIGVAGNTEQGQGGPGRSVAITGTATMYAGGGGGGRWNVNGSGPGTNSGGSGGGGAGSIGCGHAGTAGTSNTGGGGGGAPAGCFGDGGSGGSGIVIVRYLTPAAPSNSVAPTISGATRTGERLSASTGSWAGSPSSFTYQWKRANTANGTYSDISSATSDQYVLTDDEIGKYIKVSVVATNGVGSSNVASSVATSVVVDLSDSVVPTATTPVATLTGFTFTISNYSNLYTYTISTTSGSVARSDDLVTVTGLSSGSSATVTVVASRALYKSATRIVTGSAISSAPPAVVIDIQAPSATTSTVPQGQASVATIAPSAAGATSTTSTTVAKVDRPNGKVVATTVAPRLAKPTNSITPPVIPKVSTGESALNVDGVSTKVDISRENNQLVMQSGTVRAVLSGLDEKGATRALDSNGNLRLAGGDVVKLNVGGFQPNSKVDVWLFSTPQRLGTAVVGADGRVSGSFVIPKAVENGPHRIVITAKLPNGKSATFTLGIAVGDIARSSTLTRILIAVPIALAVLAGFMLPNQMRRRRRLGVA